MPTQIARMIRLFAGRGSPVVVGVIIVVSTIVVSIVVEAIVVVAIVVLDIIVLAIIVVAMVVVSIVVVAIAVVAIVVIAIVVVAKNVVSNGVEDFTQFEVDSAIMPNEPVNMSSPFCAFEVTQSCPQRTWAKDFSSWGGMAECWKRTT